MQTFLPYPHMKKSAQVLDRQRLGKQRVETMQIMKALLVEGVGWANHPATRMWQGYELALFRYQVAIVAEWKRRGYKDTCLEKTKLILLENRPGIAKTELVFPPWFGDASFHRAHKSNLVRKNPEHYREFFPRVPDNLPYVWPA